MGPTLDEFNSRMNILKDTCTLNFQCCQKHVGEKSYVKKEEKKQTSKAKKNNEDGALKLEKKILNIIDNKLGGIVQSLSKRDQEFEDTIENKGVVFSAQLQKQNGK